MHESEHTEFFSQLWKCPFRRFWKYGRKFLVITALGVFIWMSLDFLAIFLTNPKSYPPFVSLIIHAILTIVFSLLLTLGTHKIYLRFSSRFRPIRAFLPKKDNTLHNNKASKDPFSKLVQTKSKLHSLFRILFYTSLLGFIGGITFGYLHMKGVVPSAEDGMILYGITLGIGAILSTLFVLYQIRQNRINAEVIRILRHHR
jgi:FtsH-binding integral membrane protein